MNLINLYIFFCIKIHKINIQLEDNFHCFEINGKEDSA